MTAPIPQAWLDPVRLKSLAEGYENAATELAAWASIANLPPAHAELIAKGCALLRTRARHIAREAQL